MMGGQTHTAETGTDSALTGISLTLAVPYYSGFDLLLRTLESIAVQRGMRCSLLICDDSPAGLSAEEKFAVQNLIAERMPWRLLRNERNLGMALTWSRCIDEAETDLVTIVHGDDELAPDYAREIVALAEAHPTAAAVFCGASVISEEGKPLFSFPDVVKRFIVPKHRDYLELRGDPAVAALLRGNFIFCPTLCYRRSALGQSRFDTRYRMVPDLDLLTRLLFEGRTLVGTPEKIHYRYRRHRNNATQTLTRDRTRFTEECQFYDEIYARANTTGYLRTQKVAAERRIIKGNLLFCIASDVVHRRFRDSYDKARLYRSLFWHSPSA